MELTKGESGNGGMKLNEESRQSVTEDPPTTISGFTSPELHFCPYPCHQYLRSHPRRLNAESGPIRGHGFL
jgi:hypothetical protein